MGGGGSRGGGGGHSMGGGGRSMGSSAHRSGSRSVGGAHSAGSFGGAGSSHRSPGSSGSRGGGFGGPSHGSGGPGFGGPSHGPGGPGYSRGPMGPGGPGMPPPPPHRHYYGGPGTPPPPRRGGYRSGCGSIISTLVILIIVIAIVFSNLSFGGSGSNQKLNRDKYTGDVDSSQGYYIDDSEGTEKFIDKTNEATLISGFKTFYNRTGVFPFLYIAESKPDASEYAGYDTYEDMLYETLFNSEGNVLFVYIADEDNFYTAAGYNTTGIIDDESLTLIYRQIDSRWSSGDVAIAFGDGLAAASKNIMAKSNTRVIVIAIIAGVVVIVVINVCFKWWKKKKEVEKEQAEQLEKILDTPLETFGTDMSDLTQKYDDK
jgi:hypothetical protein